MPGAVCYLFENCAQSQHIYEELCFPLPTVISKLLLGKRLIAQAEGLKPQTGQEASATGPDVKLRTPPLSFCHLMQVSFSSLETNELGLMEKG